MEVNGAFYLRPTEAALTALRADPQLRPHAYHVTALPPWPALERTRLPAEGLLVIDRVYDDPRAPDDENEGEKPDEAAEDSADGLLSPKRDFVATDPTLAPEFDRNPFDPKLGVDLPTRHFLAWMIEKSRDWGTPIHYEEDLWWGDGLCFDSHWVCEDGAVRGCIGVEDDDWIAFAWDGQRFQPRLNQHDSEEACTALGCSERIPIHESRSFLAPFAL